MIRLTCTVPELLTLGDAAGGNGQSWSSHSRPAAVIFGFLGVLTAVPLLAGAMVPIKLLYVQDVVGDEVPVLGDDEGP